jgi:hypothetical protein
LIVPLHLLTLDGRLDLLIRQVVIDEFERNRPRVEASVTSDVTQLFKLIRRDPVQYGSEQQSEALETLDQLAHQVPLIGAITTRNFEEIRELLDRGHPPRGHRSRPGAGCRSGPGAGRSVPSLRQQRR